VNTESAPEGAPQTGRQPRSADQNSGRPPNTAATGPQRIDALTALREIARSLDSVAGRLAQRVLDGGDVNPDDLIRNLDHFVGRIIHVDTVLRAERSRLRDRLAQRELEIIAERRALREGHLP